jgi:uncharacterized protein YbbC (DUF1343 family)
MIKVIVYTKYLIAIITTIISFCVSQDFQYSKVMPVPDMAQFPAIFSGLDILEEMGFEPLKGKRLAILANHTSVNRRGEHLLDLLSRNRSDFDIRIIFTPEFGILASGTQEVSIMHGGEDPWFGAPVKQLWGRDFKPTRRNLKDVDFILVDIQDPGIRFLSFMTTVTKVMEAAAQLNIPVMILDRPNPLNGINVDGPVVHPHYQSFVGYHLVPVRHGLTVGEYALLVNETGWIRQSERVELTVVPMRNWKREMWMSETGFTQKPFVPGVEDVSTLLSLVGMGLLSSGSNVSAGLGSERPYMQLGAPWIFSKEIIRSLAKYKLPGVRFTAVTFTPDSVSSLIANPLYRGEECHGIQFHITDRNSFSPIHTSTVCLATISRHYPRRFRWVGDNYIDKLYGHDYLRIFIAQERDIMKLPATWSKDVINFSKFRERYLLY